MLRPLLLLALVLLLVTPRIGIPSGPYELQLRVVATETYNPLPSKEYVAPLFLETSEPVQLGNYESDLNKCEAPFKRIADNYVRRAPWISGLFIGPPPAEALANGFRLLLNLAKEIDAMSSEEEEVQQAIAILVSSRPGISVGGLRVLLGDAKRTEAAQQSAVSLMRPSDRRSSRQLRATGRFSAASAV